MSAVDPSSGLPPPHAVERAVERDLAWIARLLGSAVNDAAAVSPLRGIGHPRAALRVTLADGRRVKLRRLGTPDEVAVLSELLRALAPLGFPQVIARRGRALVVEWVEGRAFADAPATRQAIGSAGRLLGGIHRTAPSRGRPLPAPGSAVRELERCDAQLSELADAERLSRTEAAAISDAIRGTTPPRPLHGIVHGDFAPENLVVDAGGALRAIDNEAVRVGVLDLDLARVWTRWPLPRRHWEVFLDAYGSAFGRRVADRDLAGWKLRARVLSAWYRVSFGRAGAEAAVGRLRELAGSGPGRESALCATPEAT